MIKENFENDGVCYFSISPGCRYNFHATKCSGYRILFENDGFVTALISMERVVENVHKTAIQQALLERGACADEAYACAMLFNTADEAIDYLSNSSDDGRRGYKSAWQEYYSQRYQRFYYCNDAIGYNSWDMPPKMQLVEWLLDVGMYGVHVVIAHDVFFALKAMMDANWHRVDALWEAVTVLSKLVGNVARCGNSVVKFRSINLENATIKSKVVGLPGCLEVLQVAGFRPQGHSLLNFPAIPSQPASSSPEQATSPHNMMNTAEHDGSTSYVPALRMMDSTCLAMTATTNSNSVHQHLTTEATKYQLLMNRVSLLSAKLDQLIARRGFTGIAKTVDDFEGGTSSSSTSKHSGKPGFKFQQLIFECSRCAHPINDGTDRLRTRSHDTPKGEFRYECQSCKEPSFNLCESCWDKMVAGQKLHQDGHTFKTHYPKESQHNLNTSQDDGSNPWGRFTAGSSAARALERLKERHGITRWF
ncbi:hypothetical protein CEUSTIGMA_g5544.t1 [Chlamydomonas eustigma]|uniref:WW domain-containing protein n=1 Tax=Chlamydomonas eustigma TaxID=1157962 RepID=A0A250X5D1_9CHLO|nr:hypothetical protein CEUSTIGMA_g5544.t1 [Chlamydomonas eustigma]|eukprot:GAX78102.1 hypothetical protein CEUSTIGMA_g5544.t1 [Chlamydomonas eustigma]